MTSDARTALARRIAQRDCRVCVVGLGYVGLPLALAFAERGFSVVGVDTDRARVRSLEEGQNYLPHLDSDRIRKARQSGHLTASSDYTALRDVDAFLISVPTPLDAHRAPDLGCILEAVRGILPYLRRGQLVVLESTTYPGTTDEVVLPLLRSSGLDLGDFFLAYSPEREDPGNSTFSTTTIPKLVGGVDEASGAVAEALYASIVSQVVRVESARVAEAAKLTENVFRAVNIALVNELKITFDQMNLDVWQVLDAAATKPFGFMRFNPGPGWGGHCIPVDPFYLSWRARQFGALPRFIELAAEINVRMHEYVVEKLALGLNAQQKSVNGARVLLLGIAYKKDLGDCRESPALPIMRQLARLGAQVSFHDPFVEEVPVDWAEFAGQKSQPLHASLLREADAVMIVTDHGAVDYSLVRECAALVVDARGVFRERSERVIQA
jgi:UDP-N-acetyl-D-glucosamine dehydrogenase